MCENYNNDQVAFAVKKLFRTTEQAEVLNALTLYDTKSYRTHLAILKLSKGNLKEFYDYLKKATEDYRDILWWAEYDGKDRNKKIENPYREILT